MHTTRDQRKRYAAITDSKKDTLHISQAHIYTCAYTEPHIDTDAALKWPN